MATLEQLSTALVNADKAGDAVAAKALANEITRMRGAQLDKPVGKHLTYEEGVAELDKEDARNRMSGANGMVGSFLQGAADIPIIGDYVNKGLRSAAAGLSSLIDGESYDTNLKQANTVGDAAIEMNPISNVAGQVAGNIALMAPVAETTLGAKALGITGKNLLTRAGASAASSGVINAADTAARGGDIKDVANSGAVGFGVGAAIPLVGAGIDAGIRAIGNKLYPTLNAIRNPADEGARRVGSAVNRDISANPANVLSPVDEAVAAQANIPLVNADRGGEVTRAFTRSVANQSPEARQQIEKVASDRFGAQSQRAVDFVKGLTSGNADDLALQDKIRTAARVTNKKAYDAAFSDPNGQMLFTPGLQELMQSPSVRQAVSSVPERSADRGAVQGFKEIGNPFTVNSQGNYVLRQKADGTIIGPNLQFWDQVKQNLDSAIGKAKRAGDNQTTGDLMGLKTKLVGELDNAVGSYKTARQGAWAAFNADDAIDAGRQFANTPKLIPEAQRSLAKLSQTEKDGFATGFASELIDKIKASGDRTNVINSAFKSQAAREQMEMVFGSQKAKQIEAYVRVEDLADRLRGALGNSTTARQLVELGLGAGGGYAWTGDWKGALGGAAVVKGARYLGERADAKAMEEAAKLLMQDNPLSMRSAVTRAAKNPAFMGALDKLGNALAIPARAGALSTNH
jgi:hypothetical protein